MIFTLEKYDILMGKAKDNYLLILTMLNPVIERFIIEHTFYEPYHCNSSLKKARIYLHFHINAQIQFWDDVVINTYPYLITCTYRIFYNNFLKGEIY